MRNKFLIIIKSFLFTFFLTSFSRMIYLFNQKKLILIKKEVTIFKDNVIFKTQDNKTIQSGYAEYNKKKILLF